MCSSCSRSVVTNKSFVIVWFLCLFLTFLVVVFGKGEKEKGFNVNEQWYGMGNVEFGFGMRIPCLKVSK